MEIIEEDMAEGKRFFCFGLEAIIAMTLGIFFLCCNTIVLFKSKIIEKIKDKLLQMCPLLKLFTTKQQTEVQVASRINSDHCCICFGDINKEVSSTCGHIFCGNFYPFEILI